MNANGLRSMNHGLHGYHGFRAKRGLAKAFGVGVRRPGAALDSTTNGATGMSDIEGKAPNAFGANEAGSERVSIPTNERESLRRREPRISRMTRMFEKHKGRRIPTPSQ